MSGDFSRNDFTVCLNVPNCDCFKCIPYGSLNPKNKKEDSTQLEKAHAVLKHYADNGYSKAVAYFKEFPDAAN